MIVLFDPVISPQTSFVQDQKSFQLHNRRRGYGDSKHRRKTSRGPRMSRRSPQSSADAIQAEFLRGQSHLLRLRDSSQPPRILAADASPARSSPDRFRRRAGHDPHIHRCSAPSVIATFGGRAAAAPPDRIYRRRRRRRDIRYFWYRLQQRTVGRSASSEQQQQRRNPSSAAAADRRRRRWTRSNVGHVRRRPGIRSLLFQTGSGQHRRPA